MVEMLAWVGALIGIGLIVVFALSSFKRKLDLIYRTQLEQALRSPAFARRAMDFDQASRDEHNR